MPTEPSKYAENQFLSATERRFPLMSEVLSDTLPRSAAAAAANAAFATVNTNLIAAATAWNAGETVLANAEANGPATTLAFDDKMASLTRQPDANTSSLLESWDNTIRGQVAYGGPIYLLLLPNGRETLTGGTKEQQLDAGRDFGTRLTAQVSKPTLVSLGTVVSTFFTAARALRTAQLAAKTALDNARAAQEPLRVSAANALYALAGQGMVTFAATPLMVDTLFDVNLLRSTTQTVPAAPADTTWTPATRTLATTALPTGATRLEAWREGPGGMPEMLAIGLPGETSVTVPNTITFDPGDMYQLWLQARNSRGTSAPGPLQSWTAP